MENYHKILEVKANASKREIKSAYRKLALKYHPDKNESKDAQKMFVLINFAYEVLHNDLVPKTHFKTDEYTPSEHPFEKWKDINTPPRDINEFKEWKKVKQDQTKENHKKEREATKAMFMSQKQRLKSSWLYLPSYLLYLLISVFFYAVAFSLFIFGLVYAVYEDSILLFIIIFVFLSLISFMIMLIARFIQLELKRYFW